MKSENNITKLLAKASSTTNISTAQDIVAQKPALSLAITRIAHGLNGIHAIASVLRESELKRENETDAGLSSRIVGGLMDALIELSFAAQSDVEYFEVETAMRGSLK